MATLAGVSDGYGVSGGTGTSVSSSGGGGGGDEGTEAPAPALAAATAVNQTGIITASSEEEIVYNCRMCRRAVFSAGDIQAHEAAQHNFHRRKVDSLRTEMLSLRRKSDVLYRDLDGCWLLALSQLGTVSF